jgi:hypothetical protein
MPFFIWNEKSCFHGRVFPHASLGFLRICNLKIYLTLIGAGDGGLVERGSWPGYSRAEGLPPVIIRQG